MRAHARMRRLQGTRLGDNAIGVPAAKLAFEGRNGFLWDTILRAAVFVAITVSLAIGPSLAVASTSRSTSFCRLGDLPVPEGHLVLEDSEGW